MIRLYVFLGLLLLFLLWESIFPRRSQGRLLKNRVCNLSLSALNSLLLTLIPFSAAAAAEAAGAVGAAGDSAAGFAFILGIDMHKTVRFIFSIIILDLVIYFQHLIFHFVPLFWQLHKVHHADSTLNVTSAVRFHPIEIVLSLGIKIATIVLFGISAEAVLLFELLLNGCAMFNHACILLPPGTDRIIRYLFVTPDMHRIHHSVRLRETNRNFGFCISLWDRIFGTYRANPIQDQTIFKLGISSYRNLEERSIVKSLLMPFDGKGQAYSIKGMGKKGA
jgi:sterol desaturase/sphingolipid hydroxylase (fatty acid hydroxylase superfamily)